MMKSCYESNRTTVLNLQVFEKNRFTYFSDVRRNRYFESFRENPRKASFVEFF